MNLRDLKIIIRTVENIGAGDDTLIVLDESRDGIESHSDDVHIQAQMVMGEIALVIS